MTDLLMSLNESAVMTSNTTEDNTNSTAFSISSMDTVRTSAFIVLLLLATAENVIACILITKRKNNDAISVALIGLSVSGILFSVEGSITVSTFLYMHIESADTFPFILCSVNFHCWLLSMLLSTEQMFAISVIRAVTVAKMNKTVVDRGLTKKKTIFLMIIMWVVSTVGCIITMTVDYVYASVYPPFCRFRSAVSVFRVTFIYLVVMYLLTYIGSVSLYGVSIVVLLRIRTRRRQVHTTDSLNRSVHVVKTKTKTSGINETITDNLTPSTSNIVLGSMDENIRFQAHLKQRIEPDEINNIPIAFVNSINNTTNEHQCGTHLDSRHVHKHTQSRRPSELTATFILGLLIVIHSALLIPLVVQMALVLEDTESVDRLFQAMLLAVVNFIVNPFIYMMSLPDIRKKTLGYLKCRTTN